MSEAPPFEIRVDGIPDGHLRVHSFHGRETISKAYAHDVVVTAPAGSDLETAALGARAALVLHVGKAPRAWHGVLCSVRLAGVHESSDSVKYHLRLVPRLHLLKRKTRTRIFQNVRVVDVVTSVLQEAGIGARWQLLHAYPVREYVTQYEESDYRFVTRLLAEAGIFFYFPEGPPADAATLAASMAVGAAGTAAGAVVGSVAGSAAGALVSDIASSASPIIPGDTVICADDASWYPAIGGDDAAELLAASAAAMAPEAVQAFGGGGEIGGAVAGFGAAAAGAVIASATAKAAPALYYVPMLATAHGHYDKVSRFSLCNSVRSNASNFREFDPERPMIRLIGAAVSTSPFPTTPEETAAGAAYMAKAMVQNVASLPVGGAAAAALGAVAAAATVADDILGQVSPAANLETYDHHGPFLFPKWGFAGDEAPRILRQKRRRAAIAEGTSGCPDLAPGHRFDLHAHPTPQLDRPYAVISVDHRGQAYPENPGVSWTVYENDFACVPAEQPYPPPRPKRKPIQVVLTATVVGPPGEEIFVDSMGQIKVQFHWDREGTFDDKSSCWIRTMQPWGGIGWGVQFIPRVGMEVVVTFEGGDPDKPIVLGSIYNATHPSPFVLPGDRTRSGWRTQSSPGGGGFNELSFEDAASSEQIFLHAQRNLDEVVENDHTEKIGHDEQTAIGHDRTLTVAGDHHLSTKQTKRESVGKDSHLSIKGAYRQKVEGQVSLAAKGLEVKIDGKYGFESSDEIHLKGATVVIEAGEDLTIKGPGGFVRIDAGGVTVVGNVVKINSGGAPGSGSGAKPDDPEAPLEASVAGQEDVPADAKDGTGAPPQGTGQ
jgi:type VI secretion system secreted protein VgrG